MKLLLKNVSPCQNNDHLVSCCWLVLQAAPSGMWVRALPSGLPDSVLNEISWIYFHSVVAYGSASSTRCFRFHCRTRWTTSEARGVTLWLTSRYSSGGGVPQPLWTADGNLEACPIEITHMQISSCNGQRLPRRRHPPGVCVQNFCICGWEPGNLCRVLWGACGAPSRLVLRL